ncbi:2-C-methyl-D-erythritol 4-phosphate cytidylyltransferase [Clostridium tetanomorphum]|uniref:2-C-methyl-D-erythritol 4-phosphate cytidylyltransferase n=1 Tax=Clostridium tetanomorphum TaxID=1553 RepID=A0A923EB41_CLOTT|nr:2-C-methyl-D-erythritol 4-phosphate cytidylyltransferase [Clostridium tetanomorphum]KAJ52213.1 2-C-methyl-D-erythritol 4-phosphate cytidylyltransferase [Clostridium tetanomorphum DSM 665]MBC2399992.1 2-C-methyl-D-erythritol 4-phosphate cytidylyltransferase [Clostridium tetanomorphum]MBP1863796.1 2-C-methyl-D-erythritol 4-phosphate cytidylyltransferase [Clostridium tetanomorphum]NRS86372.1 2-C-methyl-D-erythritol 4-phosphate cytidylyltransferase [Clostridium tetanomorphum]NRZ95598.1 2-C-meth
MRENCAIVVAAGKGTRMGKGINKQFLKIKDKPILVYTLEVFNNHPKIDRIILVAAKEEVQYCKSNIVEKYNINKVKSIVSGGKNRQESVFNGLKEIRDANIVLIHDGARPFVKNNIISKGIEYAEMYGACSCGVKPKDTVKVKDIKGFLIKSIDRNTLINIQTPQCFKYELILKCHEDVVDKENDFTDDTSIVEFFGHKVYIYDGDYSNIKITTPEDMVFAEAILEKLY